MTHLQLACHNTRQEGTETDDTRIKGIDKCYRNFMWERQGQSPLQIYCIKYISCLASESQVLKTSHNGSKDNITINDIWPKTLNKTLNKQR